MSARTRWPWWAFLLGILSTVTAMLYVGRPWRALVYAAAVALAFVAAGLALRNGAAAPALIFLGVGAVGIMVIGAVDAFRIARRHRDQFEGAWYTRWYGLAGIYLLIVATHFMVRAHVIEPVRLPSGSMMPTFVPGDYLYISKWGLGDSGYGGFLRKLFSPNKSASPKRGELVALRLPHRPDVLYIKRIVGLPGDNISLSGQKLVINGESVGASPVPLPQGSFEMAGVSPRVHEESLGGHTHLIALNPEPLANSTYEVEVPEAHYFVLGDYRDNSRDSRHWGFVPKAHLVGRPLVIWFSQRVDDHAVRWERIATQPR